MPTGYRVTDIIIATETILSSMKKPRFMFVFASCIEHVKNLLHCLLS